MGDFSFFRTNPSYQLLLNAMTQQDAKRLEFSKEMSSQLSVINETCFTSMKWPVALIYPMFEPRAAFAVPNNYYQNLLINDKRASVRFSHGSMRSVFFVGGT